MVLLLILVSLSSALYAAEDKKIDQLVTHSLQTTFGSDKAPHLAPFLKKRCKKLSKEDPETYKKLIAYDQKNHTHAHDTQKKS